MVFDIEPVEVKELTAAEETKGSLEHQDEEDKLMKSVLQNDKSTIEEGKLINEALQQGLQSFNPDMMFSQIIKNYQITKNLFGERLLRLISGYNPEYIKKNVKIPEFQKELRAAIEKTVEEMKDKNVLDNEGRITDEGLSLASYVLYMEELEHLLPKGMAGKKVHKSASHYGERGSLRPHHKEDRYKDVAIRKSIRTAIRRGHKNLLVEDLHTHTRQKRGTVYVVYGLDASGSMKGDKITMAKKAGIALAHSAIAQKDHVGLVVFGSDVKEAIRPTLDFHHLIKSMVQVRPSKETDFLALLHKAIELFPNEEVTKHLVVLTDALPTVGKNPEKEALEAVGLARAHGITISMVGIGLDDKGIKFAKEVTQLGQGKFYLVRNLQDIDQVILEDYYDFCG